MAKRIESFLSPASSQAQATVVAAVATADLPLHLRGVSNLATAAPGSLGQVMAYDGYWMRCDSLDQQQRAIAQRVFHAGYRWQIDGDDFATKRRAVTPSQIAMIVAIILTLLSLAYVGLHKVDKLNVQQVDKKTAESGEGLQSVDAEGNVKPSQKELEARRALAVETGRKITEKLNRERASKPVNPSALIGGRLVGTVALRGTAGQILVDDDGFVWAIGETCTKIDPTTMKVVGTVSLGCVQADAIIVGEALWHANREGVIVVQGINCRTLEPLSDGIVVSEKGYQPILAGDASNLWVTVVEQNGKQSVTRVRHYDVHGSLKGELKLYGHAVNGLGLDRNGRVWLSCGDEPISFWSSKTQSSVIVVSGNSSRPRVVRTIKGMHGVSGLKVTSDGHAWVVSRNGQDVQELDTDGNRVGQVSDVRGTSHVYETPDGEIWLDSQRGDTSPEGLISEIHQVDRATHAVKRALPAKGYVFTMALTEGTIWLLDQGNLLKANIPPQ